MRQIAVVAVLLLAACSPPGGREQPPSAGDRTMHEKSPGAEAKAPPPGAIPIADEVYAVPIGEPDEQGCQRYRLWSPTKMVVQAIHYRRADGSFTMRKDEAACMQARR